MNSTPKLFFTWTARRSSLSSGFATEYSLAFATKSHFDEDRGIINTPHLVAMTEPTPAFEESNLNLPIE